MANGANNQPKSMPKNHRFENSTIPNGLNHEGKCPFGLTKRSAVLVQLLLIYFLFLSYCLSLFEKSIHNTANRMEIPSTYVQGVLHFATYRSRKNETNNLASSYSTTHQEGHSYQPVQNSSIIQMVDTHSRITTITTASSNNETHLQLISKEPFSWAENIALGEALLQELGPSVIRRTITAFTENPLNDTIPGTGNQGDIDVDNDVGSPPLFYMPLPVRTGTPKDLKKWEYPKFQTCHDLPAKLPVDRGLEIDVNGTKIIRNVGDEQHPKNFSLSEAPYCPVELDPFLPWIHDIFPTVDGSQIEFIAQNKRRCQTGKNFRDDLRRLEPQVSLLQSVSVKRIDEDIARKISPDLWYPEITDEMTTTPRYRLVPYEEASQDGMYTRFICRFHIIDFRQRPPGQIVVGETLSTYPFNYEFVGLRKGKEWTLTPKGKDTNLFWTSTLRFACPVPEELRDQISSGSTILTDGTPTLHVDVVPIRTSPRFGSELYLTEELAGPMNKWVGAIKRNDAVGFDAIKRWGTNHVLPRVEASGRWSNLPICKPSTISLKDQTVRRSAHKKVPETKSERKPYLLSACVWASESFKPRGLQTETARDTRQRLIEWIEFHLMVGFDHFYVYDNSGAHSNETSLADVLSRYPADKVTHISWPHEVCNNNVPSHDNRGERSSQYAAENSCRTRFAPFTDWISHFDLDEYLVPMGNYTSLRDVVLDAELQGTNILSFRSTRGKLRMDRSVVVNNDLEKIPNVPFLEAYNCDPTGLPRPKWADRAKKQLFRSDYVLSHFVHYSTVTKKYLAAYNESKDVRWKLRVFERPPSERVTDELHEAVMIHTKRSDKSVTSNWESECHYQYDQKWRGCYVGFAWPSGTNSTDVNTTEHNEDGMAFNCYINAKVESYWVPRLRLALNGTVSKSHVVKKSLPVSAPYESTRPRHR